MTSVAAVNSLGSSALNPRGNLWYNDESTFGHKLLAKMGWSKGKGLGKNEDGIKENLKVRVKTNNAGVGWTDKLYADMHSMQYDALLKSLHERSSENEKTLNNNDEKKGKSRSLVDLSRGFRNRLHYQKLVRGKDVSQYSEQDMKAIFLFNSKPENKNPENHDEDQKVKTETQNKELNSMETYKSKLSVSDYFAKKMKEKKDKMLNKMSSIKNDLQPNTSELDTNKNTDLIFVNDANRFSPKKKKKHSEEVINTDSSNCVSENGDEHSSSEPTVRKKKRKRLDEESVTEDTHNEKEVSYEMPKKKKKSSREKQISLTHFNKFNESKNSFEASNVMDISEMQTHEVQSINSDGLSKQLKKDKKKKRKKFRLKNLKSCLKSKSGKYDTKNVTFNECVSYRFINKDNSIFDFNSDSLLMFPDEKEAILNVRNGCKGVSEVTQLDEAKPDESVVKDEICIEAVSADESEAESMVKNEISSEATAVNKSEAESIVKDEISSEVQVEESNASTSVNSPFVKSFEFDMWAESQKQASKMQIYKNMLKGIKKHDVLRTTNLLSIKGYGNWGF